MLTQTLAGTVPLQPRNTLLSNPDSHSPLYSRVESVLVFATRDSLLVVGGTRAGAVCRVERAHAAARIKTVDRRMKTGTDQESWCAVTCSPGTHGHHIERDAPVEHSLIAA
jgi:hypothetical protein